MFYVMTLGIVMGSWFPGSSCRSVVAGGWKGDQVPPIQCSDWADFIAIHIEVTTVLRSGGGKGKQGTFPS